LDDFTFSSNLWQIGQGLTMEEVKYTHYTNFFRIYNAGDILIDPDEKMFLDITFKGSSESLFLANFTTDTYWEYNGATEVSDTILLTGIRSFRNSTSIFSNTNRKVIKIAPGWNTFEVLGAKEQFEIKFNFRFLYL